MRTAAACPTDVILVIGIGNEYAHDDAAGLLVARKLKEKVSNNVTVVVSAGDGVSLMETWKGAKSVIVIDAVRSNAGAGKVYRFDAHEKPLPAQPFRGSTHAFGLYEAVELARALNQLPGQLVVYGIEGLDFRVGVGVSSAVASASEKVIQSVLSNARKLSLSNLHR